MNSEPLQICLNKVTGSESFDEICIGRFTKLSFHRTLRIPDDGRSYPLPAGLGRFPINRVEDYASTVPNEWLKEGGFFIPLYQKEAVFIQFEGPGWHPTIAKICVGKINAVSGKTYSEILSANRQDYVVIPDQRWLDGLVSTTGTVKQFVAMPLGQGYTIESQITDEEKFGGFQIVVFDAVDGRFPERDPSIDKAVIAEEERRRKRKLDPLYSQHQIAHALSISMGIAAGGVLKQQIHKDTYGVESWDADRKGGITIHLVNSLAYKAITGHEAPPTPITSAQYQRARIPWHSHYDETVVPVQPPSIFKRILSIASIEKQRGVANKNLNIPIEITPELINTIKTPDKTEASEMYRLKAIENAKKKSWKAARREISFVIDLNANTQASDYVLRSSSNFHLGQYKDGEIDASLAIKKDRTCIEGLTWRAFCRKATQDHEGLREDAEQLIQNSKTELIGLELRAESSLLSGRYNDAIDDAVSLEKKQPGHQRAVQIISEARSKANEILNVDQNE